MILDAIFLIDNFQKLKINLIMQIILFLDSMDP